MRDIAGDAVKGGFACIVRVGVIHSGIFHDIPRMTALCAYTGCSIKLTGIYPMVIYSICLKTIDIWLCLYYNFIEIYFNYIPLEVLK